MINLLPPIYKEKLKKEEKWKIVLILELVFLVFLISLTLIFLLIWTFLKIQLELQKNLVDLEEKNIKSSELQPILEKINLTNQKIAKILSFYKNESRPSEILLEISKLIPSSIYLNSFSWNKESAQITLSGFSPTREDFLQFKKNLEEKKEIISEISFSSQILIKKDNIDFIINLKLKKQNK